MSSSYARAVVIAGNPDTNDITDGATVTAEIALLALDSNPVPVGDVVETAALGLLNPIKRRWVHQGTPYGFRINDNGDGGLQDWSRYLELVAISQMPYNWIKETYIRRAIPGDGAIPRYNESGVLAFWNKTTDTPAGRLPVAVITEIEDAFIEEGVLSPIIQWQELEVF